MITGRHELLERYLADLEHRLAAADPGERADILASVREHVESDLAALDRPATSADVAAALESLGSVDTVAAAWTPEDGGAAPGAPAPARPTGLAVAAGVLAALSVLLIWLPPVAGLLGVAALVLGIVALRRTGRAPVGGRHRRRRRGDGRGAGPGRASRGARLFTAHTETGECRTDVVPVPAVTPAP